MVSKPTYTVDADHRSVCIRTHNTTLDKLLNSNQPLLVAFSYHHLIISCAISYSTSGSNLSLTSQRKRAKNTRGIRLYADWLAFIVTNEGNTRSGCNSSSIRVSYCPRTNVLEKSNITSYQPKIPTAEYSGHCAITAPPNRNVICTAVKFTWNTRVQFVHTL